MKAAVWFSSLAGLAALAATPAEAQPSRVIILRHAEKLNAYALCDLGRERADALAKQFLGQGATQSLFAAGERPAAFMAVTLHPWKRSRRPPRLGAFRSSTIQWSRIRTRTTIPQKRKSMRAPRKRRTTSCQSMNSIGKTVVVAWEHKHIASHKLEKEYRGQDVTFRQLLRLDRAPESWSDTNYDYFWIVDYAPGNPNPIKFQAVKQTFTSALQCDPRARLGSPGAEAY